MSQVHFTFLNFKMSIQLFSAGKIELEIGKRSKFNFFRVKIRHKNDSASKCGEKIHPFWILFRLGEVKNIYSCIPKFKIMVSFVIYAG